jgi:argininosuccinate lyase
VRHAETKGCDLSALPLAELQQFSSLVAQDVYAVLTLEGSVASRDHPGGTAPKQVRAAAAAARAALDK